MQGIHTHIPKQTMSLGYTLLQLFCRGCSWSLNFSFLRWLFCAFKFALSAVCVQCPVWLFFVVLWRHGFTVCCSRILWMISKWSQSLQLSPFLLHSTCAVFLLWGLYVLKSSRLLF
jgi:hypothetical protein